jgi:hypothetical protein
MGVGGTIRELGTVLEELDGEVGSVTSVELLDALEPNVGMAAEVEVTVSLSGDHGQEQFAAGVVGIDADGRIRLDLESKEIVVPRTDSDFEIEPAGATIDAGAIIVTLRLSTRAHAVRTDGDDASEPRPEPETRSANGAATSDRDRDVPPFRDPELLAAVYDSCETFTEMSDELEMDVTAETVRRYMIDYDIHEPDSYDTGEASDGDGERSEIDANSEGPEPTDDGRSEIAAEPEGDHGRSQPIVLTDGIGLPDGVTVDTLVETVSESSTIYEVRRTLGLERAETLDLLRQLGLVDLVVGRVSTEREREIGREEIVDRLREDSAARS